MFTFLGNTQKSFTWLRASGANLSLYWFRRRWFKFISAFVLTLLLIYLFTDFFHFSPITNTQLVKAVFYMFWRAGDIVFFLAIHFFFFIFLVFNALISFFFRFFFFSRIRDFYTRNTTPIVAPTTELSEKQINALLFHVENMNSPSSSVWDSQDVFPFLQLTSAVQCFYRINGSFLTLSLPRDRSHTYLPNQTLFSHTRRQYFKDNNLVRPFLLNSVLATSLKTTPYNAVTSEILNNTHVGLRTKTATTLTNLFNDQRLLVRTLRWFFLNTPSLSQDLNFVQKQALVSSTYPTQFCSQSNSRSLFKTTPPPKQWNE